LLVFNDDAVDDAAPVFCPLNTGCPLASAAETEPLLWGSALPRHFYESLIDHDAIFRECD
jgi:hypothetical protein